MTNLFDRRYRALADPVGPCRLNGLLMIAPRCRHFFKLIWLRQVRKASRHSNGDSLQNQKRILVTFCLLPALLQRQTPLIFARASTNCAILVGVLSTPRMMSLPFVFGVWCWHYNVQIKLAATEDSWNCLKLSQVNNRHVCLFQGTKQQVRLKARGKIAGNLSETVKILHRETEPQHSEIHGNPEVCDSLSLKSASHFPELSSQVSITATVSSIAFGHELPGESGEV